MLRYDATELSSRLRSARTGTAWGYHPGAAPAAEPTALAGLALRALGDPEAEAAGAWLASHARGDGSIGSGAGGSGPGWPTAMAVVLWQALGGPAESVSRAQEWLTTRQGEVFPVTPAAVVGHDTMIPGWPWADATHAFVEPTSWALLALRGRSGEAAERVAAGGRLIEDRAVATGGWNYGNTRVFGRDLRAQPSPTGLALVALAAIGARVASVPPAITYLDRLLPTLRSPLSLGWARLGLRAWGGTENQGKPDLHKALERVETDPSPVPALAVLTLAMLAEGLDVLGVPRAVLNREVAG